MESIKVANYSTWPCLLYLVVGVFSVAGQSILMIVMLLAVGGHIYLNKQTWRLGLINRSLVWLSIPAVYLFSLFYCRDFNRGWNQWLNISPLIVLCIYFYVFNHHLQKAILLRGFLSAIVLSIFCHLVFTVFQLDVWMKPGSTKSFFHSAEQNTWLIWAAAILTILFIKNKVLQPLLLFFFEFALLYFGSIPKAIFLLIFYIVIKNMQGVSIRILAIQLVLAFPLLFIISYAFFPTFNSVLFESLDQIMKSKNEVVFSWYQFLKHPITGVGLGDYIHAMWNEYNDHSLTNPDKPYFQFLHLLVSTGLLAFLPFYLIWNKYRFESYPVNILALFLFVSLLFFAPFVSQVSCSAFMIPLLITTLKERL